MVLYTSRKRMSLFVSHIYSQLVRKPHRYTRLPLARGLGLFDIDTLQSRKNQKNQEALVRWNWSDNKLNGKTRIIGLISPCQDFPILLNFSYFFWTIKYRHHIAPALQLVEAHEVSKTLNLPYVYRNVTANIMFRIYDVEMKINMGSGVSDGTRTKLVFVVWAPQTASIKQKMVSASSKDALKKKLDGIQVSTIDRPSLDGGR